MFTRLRNQIADGYKSLPSVKSFSFGAVTNQFGPTGFVGGDGYGNAPNYSQLAGPLWENSAVAACLNWIVTAFPEARPRLFETQDGGKIAPVKPQDDPYGLTDLLENPNPHYDDTVLWAGTLISYIVSGNAYWFVVRDRTGKPVELYYQPHMLVRPVRKGNDFISYYEYRVNGALQPPMPVEDVIHFRFGTDLYNNMLGMSPLASIGREVFTDNQATDYTAAVMKNHGALSLLITPDNSDKNNPFTFDPKEVVAKFMAKISGPRRGEPVAWDAPLKIQNLNSSPEDMALDVIRKYPEARICAVIGIPAMVTGLTAGLERSTFSNYEEARSAAWEDCLIPTARVMGRQATRQLLREPANGYRGNEKYTIGFDTTEVRVLQPDETARHQRAREDFKANLLDRSEAKTEAGIDPNPKDKGLYFADIAPPASGGFDKPVTADDLTTALNGLNGNGKH